MGETIAIGADGGADGAALAAVLAPVLGAEVRGSGAGAGDPLLVVAEAAHRHGAERLLNAARLGVAVAPAGFAAGAGDGIRVIGAGFDEDETSVKAVEAAAALAVRLGAALRVYAYTYAAPPAGTPTFGGVTARERLDRRLGMVLDSLPAAARALGQVVVGEPVTELVARSAEVDLLVLGAHRHGVLDRLILAGVGAAVAVRSQAPVLALPAATSDRIAGALLTRA
jgi:nucleotide-binding universal stress UspA family protein